MNLAQPLVSVIMNCYNGESFLKEAIDSVYSQTYQNWEIIFWDNCSTDRSGEIAKSYGEKVRYFRADQTTGLGEARNLAMKKAAGEFIALLDSDDVWLPERLSKQVASIQEHKAAVCYCGVMEIDEQGNILREIQPEVTSGYLFEHMLYQINIYLSTILFRKETLIKENIFFDTNLICSEEYNILMRLATKNNFAVVPDCLAKWRIHASSLTSKTISKWAFEREYTLDQIIKENPGIEKKFPEGFAEAYARADYYRARNYYENGDILKAQASLDKIKFVHIRYLVLYLVSFLPQYFWFLIHRPKLKNGLLPRVFKFLMYR